MRWSVTAFVGVVFLTVAFAIHAQTPVYWKKDHIYAGPGGKEIAIVTPPPSDTGVPTTPTNLASSNLTATSVQVSWTGSTDSGGSGLAGYKIYRRRGTGVILPVGTVSPGVTSFVDQPLLASTAYSYTVIAFDAAQNHSVASNSLSITTPAFGSDTVAPTQPMNLTGWPVGPSTVHLEWYASTDQGGSGLAGYRIYRDGNLISGPSPVTNRVFDNTGASPGINYQYTVKAVDGASNESGAASVAVTAGAGMVFFDNFDRANSSHLNSPNWINNGTPFQIQSNRAVATLGSASYWAYAFSSTGVSDFWAQVALPNNPRSTGFVFWAGVQSSTMPGYRLTIQDYTEMVLSYSSDLPGSSSQALSVVMLGGTPGSMRVEGNSATRLVKVYWNESLVMQYTVSQIYGAGIGMASYVNNGEGDRLLDNFALGRNP